MGRAADLGLASSLLGTPGPDLPSVFPVSLASMWRVRFQRNSRRFVFEGAAGRWKQPGVPREVLGGGSGACLAVCVHYASDADTAHGMSEEIKEVRGLGGCWVGRLA